MAVERQSRFCLTVYTTLLLASAVSALAQEPPGLPVGPPPDQFGPQGQPGQPGFPPQGPGGQGPFGAPQGLGPAMPMGMMTLMPMMPEMARKMQSIMALRRINDIGLTARDIASALPILKNMREAEKTLENRSNQILDAEKRELLAAQPGSPPPPDSGAQMQEIHDAFRLQMDQGWRAITTLMGPEKAGGIRSLIEGGPMMGPMMPMAPGNPNGPGGFAPGPFPVAPDGVGRPRPPDRRPGGLGLPASGPPAAPPIADVIVLPGGEGQAPPPIAAAPGEEVGDAPDSEVAPPSVAQGPVAPPPAAPGRPGYGAPQRGQVRPARPMRPGQGPAMAPGGMPPMAGMPAMAFGGPRITLAELVDLLEQKQTAMRH